MCVESDIYVGGIDAEGLGVDDLKEVCFPVNIYLLVDFGQIYRNLHPWDLLFDWRQVANSVVVDFGDDDVTFARDESVEKLRLEG